MSADVDRWFAGLPTQTRGLAEELRSLVRGAGPPFTESIKWGHPNYALSGNVCYIDSHDEKGFAYLGFFNGALLSDPTGIVEGTGKGLRHVKVRAVDPQRDALTALVREAAALNGK